MESPIPLGLARHENSGAKYNHEKDIGLAFVTTRRDGKILPQESTNEHFETSVPIAAHPEFETEL